MREGALGRGLALLVLVPACGGARAGKASQSAAPTVHAEPGAPGKGAPTCPQLEARPAEGFQKVADLGGEGAWSRPTDGLLVELRWNVPWQIRACWRRGERVSGCRTAEVVAHAADRRLRLHLERAASALGEPVELVLDWTAPPDLPVGVAPRLLVALTDACRASPRGLWRGPLPRAGQRWPALRLEPPGQPRTTAGR